MTLFSGPLLPTSRRFYNLSLALAVAFILCGWAEGAEAATLGTIFCNVATNLNPAFFKLYSYIAYTTGAFFMTHGVYTLFKHPDNPNQYQVLHGIMRMIGGSSLASLPSVTAMLHDTLFTTAGPNGLRSCGASTAASAAADVPLDTMMANFIGSIRDPLTFMTSIIAICLGAFLIVRGLTKAAKYGTDPQSNSIPKIIANLFMGSLLVVVGQTIDVFMSTVFGNNTSILTFASMSWPSIDSIGGDTSHFKESIHQALIFVQLVGMISFVRGLNVIANAAQGNQNATMAQGLTHCIGGVLAINIFLFLRIMNTTFGTQFVT